MAISINWLTRVIYVPQAYLTSLGGGRYQLSVDAFRRELKSLESGEEGVVFPDTHRHNTSVTLSGVTYTRQVEIINGYTVEFENGTYTVECVGANHNIGDVKVVNSVSLVIGNSAGLVTVASGSGLDAGQDAKLTAVYSQLTDIEAGLGHNELMRLVAAVLLAKVSGAGTDTERFRDLGDTKDRVVVTVDAHGNRLGVARDAT